MSTTAPDPPSRPAPTPPLTLASWLRQQGDDVLVRMLRARPDLLHPVPSDISVLASRAGGRVSAEIALDRLDLGALQVVEAFASLPDPTTAAAVAKLLGVKIKQVAPVIARLRDAVVVWGADDELRLLSVVRDLVPFPANLGPPARLALAELSPDRIPGMLADVTALLGDPLLGDPLPGTAEPFELLARVFEQPARVAELVERLPPKPREVVELLAAGPPIGRAAAARRAVDAATAETPLRWLLAHGLLVPLDDYTVALPREVGLLVRGGILFPDLALEQPPLAATQHAIADVDTVAAGQAFTAVRLVEAMLEKWGVDPPSVLRAGGLGVRDLRRTARELDVDERLAALLIETAHGAGLLAPDGDLGECWLPTLGPAGYDAWLLKPIAMRWCALAGAWLTTTRVAGLIGRREPPELAGVDAPGRSGRAGPAPNALGPDIDRALAPVVRRDVLRLLDDAAVGAAPDGIALDDVLRWATPRRSGQLRDDLAAWSREEAEVFGFTGRGAMSSFGRALAANLLGKSADDDADPAGAAADILDRLLPRPLDYVLLQADLTAIAPGPLESDLSRELSLIADVESTGGATVFRFSMTSIRRALDAGRGAAEIHALLAARSRTPVPQPLSYLVDDIARRHGRVRVGVAGAYVRCDDAAVLSELIADRRLDNLRLHRVAPTVVVSPLAPDRIADRLREVGYAPAVEGAGGGLLLRPPDTRRAPARPRPPRPRTGFAAPPSLPMIDIAVRAIRGGDKAVTANRRTVVGTATPGVISDALPRSAASETIEVLRAAVASGQPVWIGYLNAQGQASGRIVEPLRLAGGYLTAFDHRHDEVRTFAVHRITGTAALEEVTADGGDARLGAARADVEADGDGFGVAGSADQAI